MTLRWRLVGIAVLIPVVGLTLVGAAQYYVLRGYLIYQTAYSVKQVAAAWGEGNGPLHPLPVAGSAFAVYQTTADGLPVGRPMVAYASEVTWTSSTCLCRWVELPFGTYPHLLYYLPRGQAPDGAGALDPGMPRLLYRALVKLRLVPAGTIPAFLYLPGPDGDRMVTAYHLSEDQVLVAETPLEPINQQVQAELVVFALASGAALFIVVALAVWLTSRALSPLTRVARVANEISGGAYDRRTGLGGKDEVATLAKAFDGMVDQMQEQMTRVSESEAAMRRFLADASHELRTPVTGILGHLEVLQRGAVDNPADLRRSLSAMHLTADRLARLVHDLLSLSRLDQGEMAVAAEPVDVGSAMAGAVVVASSSTQRHSVGVAPLETPLTAVGDRHAIERILVNLLDNAARYSPPGGSIEVAARRAGGNTLEVLVRDHGPGIPISELERIFERFARGDPARSRQRTEGAGLGLAISRALARRQGGDLTVVSEPGRGSTFVLRLPAGPATTGRPGGQGLVLVDRR